MGSGFPMTTEHLGPEATEDDLLAFRAAVERALPHFHEDEVAAADWVWEQLPYVPVGEWHTINWLPGANATGEEVK